MESVDVFAACNLDVLKAHEFATDRTAIRRGRVSQERVDKQINTLNLGGACGERHP
jgi:hypothetical protein